MFLIKQNTYFTLNLSTNTYTFRRDGVGEAGEAMLQKLTEVRLQRGGFAPIFHGKQCLKAVNLGVKVVETWQVEVGERNRI